MTGREWDKAKARGRDEVLRNIETQANTYAHTVVEDARAVMHDYEVDMYRLVLSIGKHYGMEKAFEIMSETVAEKRLKWMEQSAALQELEGTDVEKGFALYIRYFNPKDEDFAVEKEQASQISFRRKDYIDAIAYACQALGLDVIEVNNKVYAQAMNQLLARINPRLRHRFLSHIDGWYTEVIELA